jgi:hypothetical protein
MSVPLSCLALLLFAIRPACAASPDALDAIADLRWQSRVLLILETPQWDQDLAALTRASREIEERDLVWFLCRQSGVKTNFEGRLSAALRKSLCDREVGAGPVQLIGKDGGVKLRLPALDLPRVFTRIDSMPMRLREMRRSERP